MEINELLPEVLSMESKLFMKMDSFRLIEQKCDKKCLAPEERQRLYADILLSFRYRYEHYESMGALYRSMNAECLRMTLDKRLWELFIETIRIIADDFDINADDLFGRMLTNPQAEQFLSMLTENSLKQAS